MLGGFHGGGTFVLLRSFSRGIPWKLAIAVFLAFGLQLEAGAGAATFVTFDPPGSTATTPSEITPDGLIIGYYTNASGVQHGFMRTPDGTITTFDPPDSTLTTPTSINPDGEIAGAYCDTAACASSFGVGARGFVRHRKGTFVAFAAPAGQILPTIYNPGGPPPDLTPAGAIAGTYSVLGPPFTEHGFVRHRNGTIKTIDVPGATLTEVLAINPSGTIVGDYDTPTLSFAGFIRTPDEKVTTITIPGSCPGNTIPVGGINPAGEVAGDYSDSTCTIGHGYLRMPDGTITTFDPPGSIATAPMAINPAGGITGNFFTTGSTVHGFVRHPSGTIVTFDPPGSTDTFPFEINPAGVIIGSYLDAKFVSHGFVRLP